MIKRYIDGFKNYSILVVGDVTIDKYVFVSVQGVNRKDLSTSFHYDYEKQYAGGALAVARHLSDFVGKVKLVSMMGDDKEYYDYIRATIPMVDCQIFFDAPYCSAKRDSAYLRKRFVHFESDGFTSSSNKH